MKVPPHARRSRLAALSGVTGAALLVLCHACSSGLENVDPKVTAPMPDLPKSHNLRFAFDPNFELDALMSDLDVTGGVVPTTSGAQERPVAFVAFVTTSQPADTDDPVAYNGAVRNVFVAAVDSDSIDERAFSYSMAGTMRHARCMTCHQMNVDPAALEPGQLPPTPFLTQEHFVLGGGKPPLNDFDSHDCIGCHFEDWLAPGPSFDLRNEGTRDLFVRAQTPPSGLDVHFRTDPRVLWALGDGATPFGGAADDDHDGIDEPEDHDNVRRHAPGGATGFVRRLDDLLSTADPVTGELEFSSAPNAVQDVVLVSRNVAGNGSGNGASRAPSITYVPNPSYDPAFPTATHTGTLYVAYESDATNMSGGTTAGFTDVFRVAIEVHVRNDGTIDLEYQTGQQIYVSESFDAMTAGGNSTAPDISADGGRITFVSEASNLVSGMLPVCRPEVYLWDVVGVPRIALVSHLPGGGNSKTPGNQGSVAPRISPDGVAVVWESDASNLVSGDTNGKRDVFYALTPTLVAPGPMTVGSAVRASVPDGGGQFDVHSVGGSIHHDAGAVRVAFGTQEGAPDPVVAVLCPEQVVEFSISADTYFDSSAPTINLNSTNNEIGVGWTGDPDGANPPGPKEFRAAVRFDDITSMIPPNSTILSVEFSMELFKEAAESANPNGCTPGGIAASISMFRMNAAWVESTATWNSTSGQFSGTSSSTVTGISGHGRKFWFDDTLGDGLVKDVQDWVNGFAANNGWMLDVVPTSTCSVKLFRDRESGPATEAKLLVNYQPPPAPLPSALTTPGVCTVYLRDTASGRTYDLNRTVDPDGEEPAEEFDVDGSPLAANATNPVLSPYGDAVLFESMASNLDVRRDFDENRLMDVVLVDLTKLDSDGFLLPYKVSVTADGGMGDGPSHDPVFGGFSPRTDAFPLGLALFATQARNLGDADPADTNDDGIPDGDNFMTLFLREGGATIAEFAARPARQGMNKAVAFEDRSSGFPTTYTWDFGDGSPVSNEATPSHAYTVPGFYPVTLTVSGELGSDSRVRTDYIHVLGPVVATFTTDKDTTNAPDQVPAQTNVPNATTIFGAVDGNDANSFLRLSLDSSASTEFPDSFTWTLTRVNAGGTPVGPATVVSKEANPTDVRIDKPGFYDLALNASGAGGAGFAKQRIEAYQAVRASFSTSPSGAPGAGFIRGNAPFAVEFTDTTTGDVATSNGYRYEFGDSDFTFVQDPTHTYNSPGVFLAELQVDGAGGDSSTSLPFPVIVDGVITSAFSVDPQPVGSLPGVISGESLATGGVLLVDFTNLSANAALVPMFFRWNFGIGVTGKEQLANPSDVSYSLANPENVQTFAISLIASKINPAPVTCFGAPAGTCDDQSGTLRVFPKPIANTAAPGPSFVAPGNPNRPPHTVDLDGNVFGDGAGTEPIYRWYRSEPMGSVANVLFASGTTIGALSQRYEFPDPGIYKVVLEVETNGPGGTRQIERSTPRDVTVSAATFTQFYTQSIAVETGAKCTTCHGGPVPKADLNWRLGPGETISDVWHRIVEDNSGNPILSTACNTTKRRIQPADPANSVVHNVLTKPSGPLCTINMRINLAGSESDKDDHVDVLRSWILDGAPNN
ncbi:MAG: PKD domain-containing protein [Planctomycetota bacterium]